MHRTSVLRVSAGAAVAAGTLALVPTPSGAQFQQTLTITKAVEGTPGDEEFDFLVDCEGESTGVEFTLADGESIVLEEESDLGVTFSAGIECVILEREGDDPPDEVEASGEFETIDPQDTGAPVGRWAGPSRRSPSPRRTPPTGTWRCSRSRPRSPAR